MVTVGDICGFLEQFAPVCLAEDWDNVGLLLGDRKASATRVMTCLTVTPETVAEALNRQVELIVTHHPFPFSAVKQISTDTHTGKMLWQLASAGVSVYSPHTAFDSAQEGINQQLAAGLRLEDIQPLQPVLGNDSQEAPDLGAGRFGCCEPTSLSELIQSVKKFTGVSGLYVVGDPVQRISKVGIACGSGGNFIHCAVNQGCDVLITGAARFHTCLEARALGIAMIMPGHFASERFALETLARQLQQQFSESQVWASEEESDPLIWS